jgi:hypothetical protein
MELIKNNKDKEDSRSGKEIKKIKDSKSAVLIKSSLGGLSSKIVIKSSLPKFNKSSPGELGSKIVIRSSPPEFDGLGIGMQSKESDIQLPGWIETSSQTVVGSQTVPNLNKQGVC